MNFKLGLVVFAVITAFVCSILFVVAPTTLMVAVQSLPILFVLGMVGLDIPDVPGASRGAWMRKNKETKRNDMRVWFTKGLVYKLGCILAYNVDGKPITQADSQRLADVLASKGSIDLREYPFLKSLASAVSNPIIALREGASWLCPACDSAHGTRIGCSNSTESPIDPLQLRGNVFYLRADGTLFTISTTCYGEYVKAQGLEKRILARTDWKPAAVKTTA